MTDWTYSTETIIIELPPCPKCGGPLDMHGDGRGVLVSCYNCYIDYPSVDAP